MEATRIAVLQMTSGIDPEANGNAIAAAIAKAGEGGAAMLFTPEMSGLLDRNRERAAGRIVNEAEDPVLARVREAAARSGIMVALGSLAVAREDGHWANRSFVIGASGEILARYDKIHMFDVSLNSGETWNESAAYAAGEAVVTAPAPLGLLGLTICYDMRFPAL
ncbi:MAG: carbon-nitrogen hydrolase family protein, partial [Alphaproteobacteria bacterium]|nr:carbon-nitrogen hydrolase family protein [Alphaproteobacteria bacterium]